MKEFLLLVRSNPATIRNLSVNPEYLRRMNQFIYGLASQGLLVDVTPLDPVGNVFIKQNNTVEALSMEAEDHLVMVTLHIRANDMDEAIEVGRSHPVLDEETATIEI